MPGETDTLASVSRNSAKSSEPMLRYGSGMRAQTNIVPLGLGIAQPVRAKPSINTSRRC